MKRYGMIFSVAFAMVLGVCGCQKELLKTGKYEPAAGGREEFAAVYNDLIFLRLPDPQEEGRSGGYWDWAGKYKLTDGRRIELDMPHEMARIWNFYYDFYFAKNQIKVVDLGNEKTTELILRPNAAVFPGTKSGNAEKEERGSGNGAVYR